jgi:hypothetical protein
MAIENGALQMVAPEETIRAFSWLTSLSIRRTAD